MAPQRRIIDDENTRYLKGQIESSDPVRIKNALQRLCKLYRQGMRFRSDQLRPMQQCLIGLTFMGIDDEKVRRWTLNAFARIGNEETSVEPIQRLLGQIPEHEVQTAAAGVAAIYKIVRNQKPSEILDPFNFNPQLQVIAALQHVAPIKLDLSPLPLNVESAKPDFLRLALLVIGLDKSPENLLNPRHTDAQMVKVLGGHHDVMVSQYSVWAITENKNLGLRDLGVDLKEIEAMAGNIRAWVYQLIGMNAKAARDHFDILVHGSQDNDADARGGLILGLRDVYLDGLDRVVLEWVDVEQDREVRDRLYDHMIRQSDKCSSYATLVIELYEKEHPGSPIRQRMEASAAGTDLYARFRQVDVDGSGDLFRGATWVTNNNSFINQGTMNVGALSQSGTARNDGESKLQSYNPQIVETIRTQLIKAEEAISASSLGKPDRDEVLQKISVAKSDPAPDKVKRAVDAIDEIGKIAGAGIALAPVLSSVLGAISTAIGLG